MIITQDEYNAATKHMTECTGKTFGSNGIYLSEYLHSFYNPPSKYAAPHGRAYEFDDRSAKIIKNMASPYYRAFYAMYKLNGVFK